MDKTGSSKRPGRYRLYDRIKLKVSLHAMNLIIIVIIVLIAAAVVIGMLI